MKAEVCETVCILKLINNQPADGSIIYRLVQISNSQMRVKAAASEGKFILWNMLACWLLSHADILVQFKRPGINAKIYFLVMPEWTPTVWKESYKMHGSWIGKENKERRRKTQAGRRDKAIDLHCQSGEAINNSVTIKRERERVWRARVGCIKETQQNPVRRVLHLAGH